MESAKRARLEPSLAGDKDQIMPLERGQKVWLRSLPSTLCQSGILGKFDVVSQRWLVHVDGYLRHILVRPEQLSAVEPSACLFLAPPSESTARSIDCPASKVEEEDGEKADGTMIWEPYSGPSLSIMICQVSGEVLNLSMPACMMVVELLEEIASKLGIWSHKVLHLSQPSGELLAVGDRRTLEEIGLVDGSCLTLVRSRSPWGSWRSNVHLCDKLSDDIVQLNISDELQVQWHGQELSTGVCIVSDDGNEISINVSNGTKTVVSFNFQGQLSKDGRAMIGLLNTGKPG